MLRLHGQYAYMMAELADPRADSLPLMSSVWPTVQYSTVQYSTHYTVQVWPTIALCCSYVYLITVAGPRSSLLFLVAFLKRQCDKYTLIKIEEL